MPMRVKGRFKGRFCTNLNIICICLTLFFLYFRSVSVSESLEQESIASGGPGSDVASQKSEASPISTPQTSKRKSIQGRKLRPKSIVDEAETPDLVMTSTQNVRILKISLTHM